MVISLDLLEKTCKNMIETILTCLDHAKKGTIYQIGPMPELRAVRVTSGIRQQGTDQIQWGLPAVSDYNDPGKTWEQYRDRPGYIQEAMGWCVEQQKSWTADNPYEDIRSVNKQLRGEIEDSYHMEPVLVRKADLYEDWPGGMRYPLDWQGNPIWQNTEYIVAAVIKIHFLPFTLRRHDRNTKTIRELSRALGTELLSLHLRETLAKAQEELTHQRIESCKILAHELRNAIMKFSFAFSAVNTQISIIREEWERQLHKAFPQLEFKSAILGRLNELIRLHLPELGSEDQLVSLSKALAEEQNDLASLSLLPDQAEVWLKSKIQPKWERLLARTSVWDGDKEEILGLLKRLEKALWLGTDNELADKVTHVPEELRKTWVKLAYIYFLPGKLAILEEILQFLEHPALDMPHKHQVKKTIKSLKALVEIIPEVHERTNRIIMSLRNGDISNVHAD